jgi:hypothetical protein
MVDITKSKVRAWDLHFLDRFSYIVSPFSSSSSFLISHCTWSLSWVVSISQSLNLSCVRIQAAAQEEWKWEEKKWERRESGRKKRKGTRCACFSGCSVSKEEKLESSRRQGIRPGRSRGVHCAQWWTYFILFFWKKW